MALLKDGQALLDLKQSLGGRGIYLCPTTACAGKAAAKKPPKAALKRSSASALGEALERAAAEVDQIPKGVR